MQLCKYFCIYILCPRDYKSLNKQGRYDLVPVWTSCFSKKGIFSCVVAFDDVTVEVESVCTGDKWLGRSFL